MFNWSLFLCLTIICVPGLLITLPSLMRKLAGIAAANGPTGKQPPPTPVLLALSFVQSMLMIAAAAAVGTALTPKIGLGAPFFEALISGQPLWPILKTQLPISLVLGIGGALVIVAAYYLFFRPRLDEHTVRQMESLRVDLGLWARITYGGIVEEVQFRWGVLTLIAWLAMLVFGGPTAVTMWGAIILSGLLFGIGHLPSYRLAGCQVTPLFLTLMITLNLWATLICGWLFWQHGLLAAMVAHMLYHIVWLPFDRHYYKPTSMA